MTQALCVVEMSTIVTQTQPLAVTAVCFSAVVHKKAKSKKKSSLTGPDLARAIPSHTSLCAVHQGRPVTAAGKCSGSTSDPL